MVARAKRKGPGNGPRAWNERLRSGASKTQPRRSFISSCLPPARGRRLQCPRPCRYPRRR
jgi:hypothetical protein